MSDLHHASEEDDRVRKELEELPKLKAPQYFESRLRQRIQSDRKQSGWFAAGPLPAFATVGVVCIVAGTIGYYAFFVSSPGEKTLERGSSQDSIRAPAAVRQPKFPAETRQSPTLEEPMVETPRGQAGPNAPAPDITIESGVKREPENSSSATDQGPTYQMAPSAVAGKGVPRSMSGELDQASNRNTKVQIFDSLNQNQKDSVMKADSLRKLKKF